MSSVIVHSLPSKYQILCNTSIRNWIVGTWSNSRWRTCWIAENLIVDLCVCFWCWFSISMMQKFDWRPNYGSNYGFSKIWFLIFHLCTKFGAKMLIDAQIMAKNRNSRWRPSAILEFLYHYIGPPTKSFRWATSACQILCKSDTHFWGYRDFILYYKQIQHGSSYHAYCICFHDIIQSQIRTILYSCKQWVSKDDPWPMLKLIFYCAKRWMDTALNLVLQQNWQRIIFCQIFIKKSKYKI